MILGKPLRGKLTNYLAEYGYEVSSFGEANSSGYYRPVIKGKNTPISIKVLNENTVVVYDFSGQLPEESNYLQVKGGDLHLTDAPVSSEADLKEARKATNEEAIERMAEVFADVERLDPSEHPLFVEKLLVFPKDSGAFLAKSLKVTDKWTVQNAVVVPFTDIDNGKVIGAQFRLGSDLTKKFSVTGSRFGGAFHLLQKGKVMPVINQIPTFIVESFTTACTIAECQPDARVVCTAGMGNLTKLFDKITDKEHALFKILVLDKTKNNEANVQLEKIEQWAQVNGIPSIQPPKTDVDLSGITDFNDMCLLKGMKYTKTIIGAQTRIFLPLTPEVLTADDGRFTLVSPQLQDIVTVIGGSRLVSEFKDKLGTSWLDEFFNMYHITPDEDGGSTYEMKEALLNHLKTECHKNRHVKPKGEGIYKEGDKYVANLQGGRFILDQGDITHSLDMKPFGKNIYLEPTFTDDLPDISKAKFSKRTVQRFMDVWKNFYTLDKSYAMGMLGYITQAAYAPFSPFRTHMWLVGKSGTGKSFILGDILENLALGFSRTISKSTVAGIEQYLTPDNGSQNCPLISYDEAAGDTPQKAAQMEGLLKLARDMARNSDKAISLKGTKNLKGKTFQTRASLILASTTHTLHDIQEISRFCLVKFVDPIMLDNEINVNNVHAHLKEIAPSFVRGILLGAPHFLRLLPLVRERIQVKFKTNNIELLSHKLLAITSIVTGLASLIKALGYSDVDSADKAVLNCNQFIGDQFMNHKDMVGEAPSLIDDIKNIRLYSNGMELSIDEALDGDEELNKVFAQTYGVYYSSRHHTLRICLTKFNLNRLVKSKRVVDPFFCNKSMLLDAMNGSKIAREAKNQKCPYTGKYRAWCVIDLGGENE